MPLQSYRITPGKSSPRHFREDSKKDSKIETKDLSHDERHIARFFARRTQVSHARIISKVVSDAKASRDFPTIIEQHLLRDSRFGIFMKQIGCFLISFI
jgi:hypothetical protein